MNRVRRFIGLRLLWAVLAASALAGPVSAQSDATADLLVPRLEQALNAGDQAAFLALFDAAADAQARVYARDLFPAGVTRTVVRERDRLPLEGAPAGEGFRLVVEFFVETPGRARILTAGLDIRRLTSVDSATWRIIRAEGLTSVEGLYRLRLNTSTPYSAREFTVSSEDLEITLHDGTVFQVDSDEGVTGLVLIGRGDMRFAPAPAAERGQLRIFSGAEILDAPFETAFIRVNPSDYRRRAEATALTPGTADARLVRRAQDVFARESIKTLTLDLDDLSRDIWHLLPPAEDFLSEVQTRRYGNLTYTRSGAQAEDITLFQRERRRTIALYPSLAKLAARGRFYSDDLLREYDVLDYNIDAALDPSRRTVEGRARLAIRARTSLSTLTLRLAETLNVSDITSVEFGRLLFLRVKNQNTLLVNLPRQLTQDADLTLFINYAGPVASQDLESEALQVGSDVAPGDLPIFGLEPHYTLSNRSYWYPQNPVPDYSTASLRLTVPDGFAVVASGAPVPAEEAVVSLRDLLAPPNGKVFYFRAAQPVRYLSFVAARLTRVAERSVTLGAGGGPGAAPLRLPVTVHANPRQQARGRALMSRTEDVIRFYASVLGDAPYSSTALAVVEGELPGGHSPAYFAILSEPLPNSSLSWRGDPAAFDGYPEFFLAHELAHQWWGQAVGWKNYHEQWLSEGFAQYFAALYAQKSRGDRVFTDMLRQFRRWSIEESDQGPISLGYRLGHIKGDLRVYRALVYNKGAGVLHMLRRMLGDEPFFGGLRRFYEDRKFQKAGTDDLQRAFEAEAGRSLSRFFERWIHGTTVPRLSYQTAVRSDAVAVRFEQAGDELFELPVTVTLTYSDGRTSDIVVIVGEKVVEQTIPTDGVVRQVQINRDSAALAEFQGS